jgi:hypothetical protein
MAMVNLSGIYYINPQDVAAIRTETNVMDANPFVMTVVLRNGKELSIKYAKVGARDEEARRLSRAAEAFYPEPVTLQEIENLLEKMKGAIRRDIKALREDAGKAPGCGSCE